MCKIWIASTFSYLVLQWKLHTSVLNSTCLCRHPWHYSGSLILCPRPVTAWLFFPLKLSMSLSNFSSFSFDPTFASHPKHSTKNSFVWSPGDVDIEKSNSCFIVRRNSRQGQIRGKKREQGLEERLLPSKCRCICEYMMQHVVMIK